MPTFPYHFPCFADGLVLVYVSVFGGLLLLDFIHDGINGNAEASHAWQVADGYVELQSVVPPRVFRATAALAAHRRLAEQLCAVEEPRPHLDLGVGREVSMSKGGSAVILLFNLSQPASVFRVNVIIKREVWGSSKVKLDHLICPLVAGRRIKVVSPFSI